ncbi:MAG: adenylyltransferase/cytidyltransferase family protein [Candidatus Aenigmarchaeota archaeon]|nr:adenylyltransferase/cytidyltransferase family protein [Candidatus Aenigmarchaeota archaeon]
MKKVMVGGVFNAVHPGHEFFLNKALEHGDFLIVVIATDRTVMKKKGYLLKKQEERKEAMERLDIASRVIIGDNENFFKVVAQEKPDVIVLGYDQTIDNDLRKKITDAGIEIRKVGEKFKDYSTSEIARPKKGKIYSG